MRSFWFQMSCDSSTQWNESIPTVWPVPFGFPFLRVFACALAIFMRAIFSRMEHKILIASGNVTIKIHIQTGVVGHFHSCCILFGRHGNHKLRFIKWVLNGRASARVQFIQSFVWNVENFNFIYSSIILFQFSYDNYHVYTHQSSQQHIHFDLI